MIDLRRSRSLLPAVCAVLFPMFFTVARPQDRLLDACESTEGWRAVVSEGAGLSLRSVPGRTGQALAMDFDLSGVYGYVIAQKDIPVELPENYQFSFDMRADAPVNNFEFKVIDEHKNVHWIKKLNVTYPKEWTRQRIKKRHLSFAWGPLRDAPLRSVRQIEFVVSVGNGGRGTVLIDNFRLEPIDDGAAARARTRVSIPRGSGGTAPRLASGDSVITRWLTGPRLPAAMVLDFGYRREFGGLVIDWDSTRPASGYAIELSDDGKEWAVAAEVRDGNGGRDYITLPEAESRYLRCTVHKAPRAGGAAIRTITVKSPAFSATPNDLFRTLAASAPRGQYPKYFLNEQSYWTVMGVPEDHREALINEQGMVEVDKASFSLEPFLAVGGKLITWQDVTTAPALAHGYLPIPSVTWRYGSDWQLVIEPVAAGAPGNSMVVVRYALTALRGGLPRPTLYVAIRPFQVNPPWQFLNIDGGVARIDSIRLVDGRVRVNEKDVIPMSAPSRFGATPFESGEIIEHIVRGMLPAASGARDAHGFASAALAYDLSLTEGETQEVFVAVPFHRWNGSPVPGMTIGSAASYFAVMAGQTARDWTARLSTFRITGPPEAQPVIRTVLSNLAYIMINRDGPGIQPGSRSYERSWIRDGSLTATALLQTGHHAEVRAFLDWYALGQFPSGKVPCVIDSRGPDAVPEHDSHGQFIYAIMQYYRYTLDTAWLQGKYDAVVKAVRYIQSLRAERKTDAYRNGTPEQRALYGLVPESISHEGYWDVPRHSYWDGFFVLRGLKDAAAMAAVLGRHEDAAEFAAERDDFRKDLYASMRQAMTNAKIDYIPGCAELGDFDATSTTVGVNPGGELGHIPEPQLHATFDRYFAYFQERKVRETGPNYTPYETRLIGTFVHLGQRRRVEETLQFFMQDRRPPAWNHWAEVVWRDPATPKFIGDMPHTWVGSDFIRSVRTMFVYEHEQENTLVLGAGLPLSWVASPTGVRVEGLPTIHGPLTYGMKQEGDRLVADIGGGLRIPAGGIVLAAPDERPVRSMTINGRRLQGGSGAIVIHELPASVILEY